MKNQLHKLALLLSTMLLFCNVSFSQNIFKEKYVEKEWSKRKRQNEISGSQAIQILTKEFSHIKGNRNSFSYSINDWDKTSTKFVKSNLQHLPILNTMKLSSDDLKVIAFAKQNEILKILSNKYNWVKLRQPGNIMPSNFGSWYLIETIDGKTGWIFSKPENSSFSNTTSINRPIYRPRKNNKKAKPFPWFWAITIGCLGFYLLRRISSYKDYSRTSSGGYSNSSNRNSKYSYSKNKYSKSTSRPEKSYRYGNSTLHKGKWYNENKAGRIDKDGNIYKGEWYNENKTGRIDKDGNIYKGQWYNEDKSGRIDKDGNIYKGKWYNEEKSGRIDKDGNIYKGKWYNEEKVGRVSDNSKKDDCFLTTACVNHKNLADDCYELQVLRNFRDTYLCTFKEGIEHLKEYYFIAPEIVSKINKHSEKEIILEYLYESLVIKSIILISENKEKEAFLNYKNITEDLKSELLTLHNNV